MQLKLEDLDKSSTKWGVDINTINFEELMQNRLSRKEVLPSSYPDDMSQVLYKDVVFKLAFGVITGNYNPVESTCEFINEIFYTIGIDNILTIENTETSSIPQYATIDEFADMEKKILNGEIDGQMKIELTDEKTGKVIKKY